MIDLFIAGAQKAGTTSLKNYLSEHPEVSGQITTEFELFSISDTFSFEDMSKKYFPDYKKGKVVIAKYAHLYKNEEYVKRLYNHNSNCKIVFIVREPVKRLLSAYSMGVRDGWIDFEINDVLEAWRSVNKDKKQEMIYNVLISLGFYDSAVEKFLKFFPLSNIKIIGFNELKNNSGKICKHIFEWIEVDPEFNPDLNKSHNEGGVPRSIFLTKILNSLSSEQNPLKIFIKKILPYKVFLRFSESLLRLNLSKKSTTKKEIDANTVSQLAALYEPHNVRFLRNIGISDLNW